MLANNSLMVGFMGAAVCTAGLPSVDFDVGEVASPPSREATNLERTDSKATLVKTSPESRRASACARK